MARQPTNDEHEDLQGQSNAERGDRGGQRALLARMCAPAVLVNAAQVSLVVGTCLNLINQGEVIWQGASPDWGRLLLNYAVPFLVASFSAARARS